MVVVFEHAVALELDGHPIARLVGATAACQSSRLAIALPSAAAIMSPVEAGVEGRRAPVDEARNPHAASRQLRHRRATAAATSPPPKF